MRKTSDWTQICLIMAAGIIAAAQIGKAAIAMPVIQQDLGLGLLAVSWIVSAYAALGALGGMAAGFFASFFALRHVVIAGLAFIALGNFMGAVTDQTAPLIVSRVVEGIGFLAIAISGPTLLRTVTSKEHQPVVFGIWSAYIPVGAAFMMLAGPFIMQGDWRTLWLFNGALAAAHALLTMAVRPAGLQGSFKTTRPHQGEIVHVLRSRHLQLLAGGFFLYAVQYYALATFLPVFLVGRLGFSLAQAGTITAVALLANALGNIVAGLCLKRGVSLFALMTAAFLTIGIMGFGIFSDASPALLVAISAGLCLGVAALLPATVIATISRDASSSSTLALSMGFIQQSSTLGQLIGPVILAFWIGQFAWNGVPYLFTAIAFLGLVITILIRRAKRV